MPTTTQNAPPVVELVLGAQFSPLSKLTSGHFGLFWKELGPDWVEPSDEPLLDEQFELFDGARRATPSGIHLRFEPVRFPGRFVIEHQSKDRLIQIQNTRFHLNWRKRDNVYPSYQKLISEFEEVYSKFCQFVASANIGAIALNQWELTYVDSFSQGEYWQTPSEWQQFLPGLFGNLFSTDGLELALEQRRAEWNFEIVPQRGRLYIAARTGRWGGDKQDSLLLEMTARGPLGKQGASSLRAGLDMGHEVTLGAFTRIVDKKAKKWEPKS